MNTHALALTAALVLSANLITTTVSAAWTPSANASVETIYNEMRTDFQEKRYEDALAKHLWYHEKSKEYPGLTGVRLSYALAQWLELGKAYPPALEKMKSLRDQLEIEITKDGKGSFHKFMDFSALNGTLGESKRTTAAFVILDTQSSPLAKEVFQMTFGILVTHQEFKLAGKYLNPDIYYSTLVKNYQFSQKYAAERPKDVADRHMDYARESFSNHAATAVAVLVKNNRQSEAQKIADSASKVLDTPDFKAQLEKALQGEPPAKQFP